MTVTSNVDYYLIQNTLTDPDLAMEKRKVLHENVEEVGGHKLFTVTYQQVLQDFGVRNWNGRIYTADIVMKALDGNPIIQHDIKMGTWAAEYGHPLIEKGMNELARQMTIFPPNTCNTINRYWREDNLLMGECTTLSGGYGDVLRDRILTNFPAMASSRAVGGVDKNGVVLPGYTVVTFDTVIRPSHKTAYQVKGSERVNEFPINTGHQNTMSETAYKFDFESNKDSLQSFLMDESVSRQKIGLVCDMFKLDASTMTIDENALTISQIDGNVQRKIVMPLRKLVNAEYYNLF